MSVDRIVRRPAIAGGVRGWEERTFPTAPSPTTCGERRVSELEGTTESGVLRQRLPRRPRERGTRCEGWCGGDV